MNGTSTDDYEYEYEYPGGESAVDSDGYMLSNAELEGDARADLSYASVLNGLVVDPSNPAPPPPESPASADAPGRRMTMFTDTALYPVARRWGSSYAGGLGPAVGAPEVKDPPASSAPPSPPPTAAVVVPMTAPSPPPPPFPSMIFRGARQQRLWQALQVVTFVLACAALALALAKSGPSGSSSSSGQSGAFTEPAAASSGETNSTFAALRSELAWLRLNVSDLNARLEVLADAGNNTWWLGAALVVEVMSLYVLTMGMVC